MDRISKRKIISDIADIAQLVEQRTRNAKVAGSTPVIGTSELKLTLMFVLSVNAYVVNL